MWQIDLIIVSGDTGTLGLMEHWPSTNCPFLSLSVVLKYDWMERKYNGDRTGGKSQKGLSVQLLLGPSTQHFPPPRCGLWPHLKWHFMILYHTGNVREFVYGQLAPRQERAICLASCLPCFGKVVSSMICFGEEDFSGSCRWSCRGRKKWSKSPDEGKNQWDRHVASEAFLRLVYLGDRISKALCGAVHFLVWGNLIKQE